MAVVSVNSAHLHDVGADDVETTTSTDDLQRLGRRQACYLWRAWRRKWRHKVNSYFILFYTNETVNKNISY